MIKKIYFIIGLSGTLFSSRAENATVPYGYKLELTSNHIGNETVYRTLELTLNKQSAGYVKYTISRNADKASHIDTLYVNREFRSTNGCGKMLLYSALNDILMDGSSSISLQRHPFDLSQGDNFSKRDEQLKNWYMEFGFVESKHQKGIMKLKDSQKFYATGVVPSFTDEGVVFLFRTKE